MFSRRPNWGKTFGKQPHGGKTISGKEFSGIKGAGLGKGGPRRHRKLAKDNIKGISQSKNDIRRMARRGGCNRISALIFDEVRSAMTDRLRSIIRDCVAYVDHANRKTVMVTDVIFALKRLGNPIYGFDPDVTKNAKARRQRR
ncbi:hypothetical protein MMC13_001149 [Lambiella insularis]|nr:hypothetical protein [Lambiella insularis]